MNKAILAGLAASLLASPPAIAQGDSFCERLAGQLDLKERTQRSDGAQVWRANLLSPVQRLLLGGTAVASFSVDRTDLPEDMSLAEARELEGLCLRTEKGARCEPVVGSTVVVGTDEHEVRQAVRPGEAPVVYMEKTTIYCRNAR